MRHDIVPAALDTGLIPVEPHRAVALPFAGTQRLGLKAFAQRLADLEPRVLREDDVIEFDVHLARQIAAVRIARVGVHFCADQDCGRIRRQVQRIDVSANQPDDFVVFRAAEVLGKAKVFDAVLYRPRDVVVEGGVIIRVIAVARVDVHVVSRHVHAGRRSL